MPSVYDTLYSWARKRTTSFAELRFMASERSPSSEAEGDGLVYRLRTWPDLPAAIKTANVLRTLSVMSHRPVNRSWLLSHSKLPARQVDRLLQRLVDERAVEVIDTSKYGPDSH